MGTTPGLDPLLSKRGRNIVWAFAPESWQTNLLAEIPGKQSLLSASLQYVLCTLRKYYTRIARSTNPRWRLMNFDLCKSSSRAEPQFLMHDVHNNNNNNNNMLHGCFRENGEWSRVSTWAACGVSFFFVLRFPRRYFRNSPCVGIKYLKFRPVSWCVVGGWRIVPNQNSTVVRRHWLSAVSSLDSLLIIIYADPVSDLDVSKIFCPATAS